MATQAASLKSGKVDTMHVTDNASSFRTILTRILFWLIGPTDSDRKAQRRARADAAFRRRFADRQNHPRRYL